MPIIGGRIVKLEAEKLNDGEISKFETSFNLSDVTLDKDVLKISYTTKMTYHVEIASMSVTGEVFYKDDEKKLKQVYEDFKKDHRLPNEMVEEVIQAINFASGSVGTLGAFAIGVSAPLNMPRPKLSSPQGNSNSAG